MSSKTKIEREREVEKNIVLSTTTMVMDKGTSHGLD